MIAVTREVTVMNSSCCHYSVNCITSTSSYAFDQ